MNIRIENRRELEFDLADLEVMIKDYIEENMKAHENTSAFPGDGWKSLHMSMGPGTSFE